MDADCDRYLEDLEAFIKDPKFKHKDFWKGMLVITHCAH